MSTIPVPKKPFPSFKWRWAVLTPTESLNEPSVFLGVLRAFHKNENHAPSSPQVLTDLGKVQKETGAKANLVRTPERNLMRNSGQYWKSLGLLAEAHGRILITPFGRALALGEITQVEFATTIVKILELPNQNIFRPEKMREWINAGLHIKPLELILKILSLIEKQTTERAYITPDELIRIVIPLSGQQSKPEIIANALLYYRDGKLDISGWPDCAPRANDKRMAREFLLFLNNHGFCEIQVYGKTRDEHRFYLSHISNSEIAELEELQIHHPSVEDIIKEIRRTQIPASIERKRVSYEIIKRPNQSIFRKNILKAFGGKCILTGVTLENALEAAHIIPVYENGNDIIENGLCLRTDIHRLFDSGHIRIKPGGNLLLSTSAAEKNNYGSLPKKIDLPEFVDHAFLEWRIKYL